MRSRISRRKAYWNARAEALLMKRNGLQMSNLWTDNALLEPSSSEQRQWIEEAAVDFSWCLFIPGGGEGAKDMPGESEEPAKDNSRLKSIDLHGERIDFSGFIFAGNARFDHATFKGNARFESATFKGTAQFHRATFQRGVLYNSATFEGRAEFDHATYLGNASFANAAFSGVTFFRSTDFSRGGRFDDATFSCRVHFSSAVFSDNVLFVNTTFKGPALFNGAIFSGQAWFVSATFSKHARFEAKARRARVQHGSRHLRRRPRFHRGALCGGSPAR